MKHSTLHRNLMLDWIKHCDETGAPMPSDDAIVERYNLRDVESARTLLAELVDAGHITVLRQDGQRVGIRLGKAGPTPLTPVRIVAPTVKAHTPKPCPPDRKEAMRAAAAKLSQRLAQPKPATPAKPISEMPERPRPETAGAQRGGPATPSSSPPAPAKGLVPERPPSQAAEGVAKRDAEPPQAVEARPPVPAPASAPIAAPAPIKAEAPTKPAAVPLKQPPQARRTLNLLVALPVFDELQRRAIAADLATGRYARDYLEDLLAAEMCGEPAEIDLRQALTVALKTHAPAELLGIAVDALAPQIAPKGRPLITSDIVRAAAEDGRPLDEFVSMLVALGMASWVDRHRERAAA